MAKLERALKQWVSLGLIDQKQANQIYQYESTKSGSWILSGLLILGVIIIGVGIISVVAANWQQIPDAFKLGIDFALLILLGLFVIRAFSRQQDLLFDVLLLGFILLCLASIGLISQIYNTGGELYQALMLWTVITFPAVTMARHIVVPFIWTGAFLIALGFACVVLFGKYLALNYEFIRSFQIWFFITGILALVVAEDSPVLTMERLDLMPYVTAYILAILVAFGILQHPYRTLQKLFLLAALSVFLLIFHLALMNITADVVYALCTIFILGLIAIFVASLHRRRLFQWLLFIIGLRFLILYFQAIGGLALTGLGLIISGILIVAMAIFWNKYRSAITVKVERWLQ
jgi:uncharacterized membrane protein